MNFNLIAWHWKGEHDNSCWWFINLNDEQVLRLPPEDELFPPSQMVLAKAELASLSNHEWHTLEECQH